MGNNNQKVTQAVLLPSTKISPVSQGIEYISLYNPDLTPLNPVGSETKVIPPKVVTLTDATTVVVDASAGTYFLLTLAGNHTIGVPAHPTDGLKICFEVKQDATGSRTLAFATGAGAYSFGAGSAPTITATAGATSLIEFSYSARVGKWLYRGSQLGF